MIPRLLLRIEGAAVLALALLLYARNDGRWLLFILLFLAPDLSFIAYLAGSRVGDRLLGYGLKYPTAFKDTHLGRV